MTGMVDVLRKALTRERRKHRRYQAMTGTFLVLGSRAASGQKIQIADISMGGLAFIYSGEKKDLANLGKLHLFTGEAPEVNNLMYDPVSSEYLDLAQQVKRCGVEFKFLGVMDKNRLKKYIKKNTF